MKTTAIIIVFYANSFVSVAETVALRKHTKKKIRGTKCQHIVYLFVYISNMIIWKSLKKGTWAEIELLFWEPLYFRQDSFLILFNQALRRHCPLKCPVAVALGGEPTFDYNQ